MAKNWAYAHSSALGMRYAYHATPDGIEVMTEDKTRYTPDEVAAIASGVGEITRPVHLVKRIFDGMVVSPSGFGPFVK